MCQITPLGSGFMSVFFCFFYYYSDRHEGVFWRLAWQHPWESELAATRSSFKTFLFKSSWGFGAATAFSHFKILNHGMFLESNQKQLAAIFFDLYVSDNT